MAGVTHVLDACALLALLESEPGAEKVVESYNKAVSGEITLVIHKINLLEVYYNLCREYGKDNADKFYNKIKKTPITINHEITDEIFVEAGRIKMLYKMSLADSIALAQTSVSNGMLLTADHHEFDVVAKKERISFLWIR